MSLKKKLNIQHPCDELVWDANEPSKYCGHCDKTVVNLSAGTEQEAKALVESGALECVSYLRKPDGSLRFKPSKMLPLAGALAASMACGSAEQHHQLAGAIAPPEAVPTETIPEENGRICDADGAAPGAGNSVAAHSAAEEPLEKLAGKPMPPPRPEKVVPKSEATHVDAPHSEASAVHSVDTDERIVGDLVAAPEE